MRSEQVFGVAPEVRDNSYVDRGNLDAEMHRLLSRQTHVAVRGPSKSGKSWLRQRVVESPLTVQCRLRKPFSDIYVDALSQLGISIKISETRRGTFKGSLSASGEVPLKLLARLGVKAEVSADGGAESQSRIVGHDVTDLRFVAQILRASGRRLVVEDFHYMSTEDRREFAFDLKALWDYGVFVVIIGVWAETNLLLHLNPDLTGRVVEVPVDWGDEDLGGILMKGGQALNVNFDPSVVKELVSLSYGNAGLLQQLALLTLDQCGIREKRFLSQEVTKVSATTDASMLYAEQLNPVYQQFARTVAAGIRTRKNATGIYAHAMAVIMEATDDELKKGLHARSIYERAVKRQPRIQFSNLKSILEKLPELQVDQDGRGLILGYSTATEEVTIVDRQLLLYRRFSTVKWPWEDLIVEADAQGGQVDGA